MEKIKLNPPQILEKENLNKMIIPISGFYKFKNQPVKYYESGEAIELSNASKINLNAD